MKHGAMHAAARSACWAPGAAALAVPLACALLAAGLAAPARGQDAPPGTGGAIAGTPPVRPTDLAPPAGWRFLPGLVAGYDTFGQRYVVDESDTLDLVSEWSTRLVTALERQGRTRAGFKNALGFGQQATRDDFWAYLQTAGRRTSLRLDQELHYKGYVPGSDFESASDYLAGTTRASARFRLTPQWFLRFEDRFEWTQFATPNRTSYDYRLNDTTGWLEREYGLLSRLAAGYGYGMRAVPDSTGIGYSRHVLRAEWEHDLGLHDWTVAQRFERRLYEDPNVRPHSFEYDALVMATAGLRPGLRLRPAYRAALLRHDRADSLYTDYDEHALELLVEGDLSGRTLLAVGPCAAFRRTASEIDRPYDQWGIKGTLTYTRGSTLWVQFSDEIGTRRHVGGSELFFTDYLYNWSSLYLNWQMIPRLGLDLFFALDPEVHDVGEDNTTMLLLSASLTYGWR